MTTILSHHTVGRRDCLAWLLSTIGVLTLLGSSTNAQPASAPAKTLPQNFTLPGEKSPIVEINEPLISAEQLLTFQRNQSNYGRALRDGAITSRSRKLVEDGIAARMLRLTIPEEQQNITAKRIVLIRDITFAGRNEINPRLKRKFREMVLEEVLKNAKLMLHNHQKARVFAITVVAEINIVEEDRRTKTPAEPYQPALSVMRDVVNDPEQDTGVKIIALKGIKRILDNTQLKLARNDLLQTAEDLARELKDPTTYFWMQQNLIRALAATKIDKNRAGDPFIVQTLAEVMSDGKRHPLVRTEAAYTIPRVPLSGNVKLSMIAWQTAKLTQEMTEAYNKNPEPHWWQAAFFKLYAAYQPIRKDAADALIPISKSPAMQAQHEAKVKAAYDQALPVIKAIFESRGGLELEQDVTAPLGEWLKANDPGEYVVYDGGPEITQNVQNNNAVNAVNTGGP